MYSTVGSRTKCKVVYLFVELRKLMDLEGYKNPTLRVFSNWVVHTTLDKSGEGSTAILVEFDKFMSEFYEHKRLPGDPRHRSLITLRVALMECFKFFGLSAKFIKDAIAWTKFSMLYCTVVTECPIVYTASKEKLKYIKRVEFQRIGRYTLKKSGFQLPFVEWKLTLKDGSIRNWGFYMGEMLAQRPRRSGPQAPTLPPRH